MTTPRAFFTLLMAPLAALALPIASTADATRAEAVDALFAPPLIKAGAPGAAVLVIQDGRKVVSKGYGLARLKTEAPITPTTVFELASCSKQFTAMAVMILAERGKLSYDDKLTKFFPEFPGWGARITVAHLLHHTGGLPDYFDAYDKTSKEGVPTSKLMLHLIEKKKKPLFAPGAKYDYSNSGYMALAQIVERASGRK
ncbi:MAG: beta-lactamase, partial [Verrucomicrobiaceae bacterium]|nr:beta-lactamase [Verrucomicrobiaceae bacterium]